ncbi:VOC family protein [Enterocloster sp.]|uniref:VOC family protein n=1 Tax=Enterocloster sp. TaxID=2719315 RepID=UPI00399FBE92
MIKKIEPKSEKGKKLKFTDFAHINIVVDDIDTGIQYYRELLEAVPIQIFRNFKNTGFAKAAGFLEDAEDISLSIAFLEIPGTKLTLELMQYLEPATVNAQHIEDVNNINGVRHVALEINNIEEAFEYIKSLPDIKLINPSDSYRPYKIDDITPEQVRFFDTEKENNLDAKREVCETIGNTYYFYFLDKYGVQWEFEQGHAY